MSSLPSPISLSADQLAEAGPKFYLLFEIRGRGRTDGRHLPHGSKHWGTVVVPGTGNFFCLHLLISVSPLPRSKFVLSSNIQRLPNG